ncbi:hypothetical protein TCAL_01945, partial [Tigriopus californicus]
VLCNTGNLTEIPQDFPRETQEIVITNQNISVILPKTFSHLKQLRRLILDSNNISEVRPFAFKDLRDMVEISVQDNPISHLPGFAFAGIRNVTNLYLGYNRLTQIDGYAFAGTEHIQMLLLNNNPIKTVNSSAFSGLKNIEFLYLPAGVRRLQSDAFNGLENVGMLKLAYLDLTEMSPFTFRGLKSVRMLVIENSDLATIRKRAFHGNSTDSVMSGNVIGIDMIWDPILGMSAIGELNISNNKIDRIEDLSISEEVANLTLSGNHILQIPPPNTLANIRVGSVKAIGNHFPCNCRVLFLLDSILARSEGEDMFMQKNKCISPLNLNGRNMSSMRQLGFLQQCHKEQMIQEEEQKERDRKARTMKKERERQQKASEIASDQSEMTFMDISNFHKDSSDDGTFGNGSEEDDVLAHSGTGGASSWLAFFPTTMTWFTLSLLVLFTLVPNLRT